MTKILQINSVVNKGSTGRIAEEIGNSIKTNSWESHIAYGRSSNPSNSHSFKIGNKISNIIHLGLSTLFDKQGFGSNQATINFIEYITELKPDIIHLHNIHGYYINIEKLFQFLSISNIPVVWTLHDCWPFTGHCAYYSYIKCEKWKSIEGCSACPQIKKYPKSITDRSNENFHIKKQVFNSVDSITFVPVSNWIQRELKQSFLNQYNSIVIHNGINLNNFRPLPAVNRARRILPNKFIILGVNTNWTERKGFEEFIKLNELIDETQQIVLVGLPMKLLKVLPANIIGFERTESVKELVQLYNEADVLINPTLEDNYPTANLEAIACGTPVITYNTGGSPESIGPNCGYIIPQKNIEVLSEKVNLVQKNSKNFYSSHCREYAEENFDQDVKFDEYIKLYRNLISQSKKLTNEESC